MIFSYYIARSYLLSKKKQNIINIISLVSVIGVAVGTMALIVILSVFNGFENLVDSLMSSFNADIKIVAEKGKTFNAENMPEDRIRNIEGVISYVEVIEENALLRYKDKQHIVTIKGVSDEFLATAPIDTMLVDGKLMLKEGDTDYGVFGLGVAYFLDLAMRDFLNPVNIYVPKRGKFSGLNAMDAFNTASVFPSAIFSIQQDFDIKYVIIPVRLARDLLDYTEEITSVELRLTQTADIHEVQKELYGILGDSYKVLNKYQQEETIYKIMKSEKWAIFFILTFILLIATFNVVGSLSMLILEKRKDLSVLWSMGATQAFLRKVFFTQGMMISLSGAVAGLILGAVLCWLQTEFGLVKLQGVEGSFVISAYPVAMRGLDFLTVFSTVAIIGFLATLLPVSRIKVRDFELQYL